MFDRHAMTPADTDPLTDAVVLPALLDGLLDPLVILDAGWRYTFVNRHAATLMGVEPGELVGRVLWEGFPAARGALEVEYRRVMETREARHFEVHLPTLGRWEEVRAFPHGSGIAVHFRDISARKQAEARRDALLAVTRALSEASSEREVVERTLDASLHALGASAGTLLNMEPGGVLTIAHTIGYGAELTRRWRQFPSDLPTPVGDTVRTREPLFLGHEDLRARYPAMQA
ncbi:PAS domain-containing protein, partial [Deinococcus pimensis]|uniref:PAS domain-containing protein n=1 Tax=Deinococcus pimensis TaxID=309888 RepID=UPI0005EB0336